MVAVPNYTIQLRRQLKDYECKGYGIQKIIDYLFTLDLQVKEIVSILTNAPFCVKKEVLLKVLHEDFDFNIKEDAN